MMVSSFTELGVMAWRMIEAHVPFQWRSVSFPADRTAQRNRVDSVCFNFFQTEVINKNVTSFVQIFKRLQT
jgi:hypothetical protein